MLASGELEPTGIKERDVGYRPAELYRVRSARRAGSEESENG
jgi:hypothetical protein